LALALTLARRGAVALKAQNLWSNLPSHVQQAFADMRPREDIILIPYVMW
jgi:hypothetical protein